MASVAEFVGGIRYMRSIPWVSDLETLLAVLHYIPPVEVLAHVGAWGTWLLLHVGQATIMHPLSQPTSAACAACAQSYPTHSPFPKVPGSP